MGRVTIDVEDGPFDAAKRAAERAQNWDAFFAEIDSLRNVNVNGNGNDFPSLEEIRAHEVPDSPRESWQENDLAAWLG